MALNPGISVWHRRRWNVNTETVSCRLGLSFGSDKICSEINHDQSPTGTPLEAEDSQTAVSDHPDSKR